jgi:hypothetical protein
VEQKALSETTQCDRTWLPAAACLLRSLGCNIDGAVGLYCEIPTEMYCPNQCSGRGVCYYGFCKCEEGWHGTDCSIPTAASLGELTDTPPEKGELCVPCAVTARGAERLCGLC